MATSSKKGQIVNRTGLSDVFGVSLPTVDAWVRQGCPYVKRGTGRGQQWEFSTADVAKWLQERAAINAGGDDQADENELKKRKLRAETLKAELELAKASGEVAPVREFERAQAAAMAAIRANMRNVPGRAVLQLLGCTDETVFKQKLMAEIDLALVTAAEADLEPEDEDDQADDE
ncbi:terminase small subunit [Achromobacter phage Mano]|uniref:Terminase small subunit n=1 Tax=Achromobacter phage Mano TaxID=2767570 RepID=A0A7L8G683_9CAUD|nr:terminase small subunit [Achromobacter phage Mano]QOE32734.1 terminase small subunit [Achromobacter phage Mano]